MKIAGRSLGTLLFTTPLLFAAVAVSPVSQPAAAQMTPPAVRAHLYDEHANSQRDIATAVAQARREHKRVLVDFGGDWCGDCQVLDVYLHQAPNRELLEKNYIVVHVPVGDTNEKNLDLRQSYGIGKKGVPALAVLDDHGKVVYSQKNTEFSTMRSMNVSAVTDFLNHWKA